MQGRRAVVRFRQDLDDLQPIILLLCFLFDDFALFSDGF